MGAVRSPVLMAFLVLVFNLTAIGKLLERGLVADDVRTVFRVVPVVYRVGLDARAGDPRPNRAERRMMQR
jgi:chromosome condensin MukBEF MukE localization factor